MYVCILLQYSVWTPLLDSLYTTLFAAYLNYLLPCSGPVPSSIIFASSNLSAPGTNDFSTGHYLGVSPVRSAG